MNESDFYSQHLGPAINSVGVSDRVENTLGGGTPDVSYIIDGAQGWCECKVAKSGKLYFEKYQIPWLRRRYRHAREVGVWVIATDSKMVWLFSASSVVSAPRATEKKWTTVLLTDLQPTVTLTSRPWRWQSILDQLAQRPA